MTFANICQPLRRVQIHQLAGLAPFRRKPVHSSLLALSVGHAADTRLAASVRGHCVYWQLRAKNIK